MKKLKLVTIIVLIGLFTPMAAWAQAKGEVVPQCFRIVNGPGKGALLGNPLYDFYYQISGFVQGPDKGCRCFHFHGFLFGLPDPNPKGCGWGCVLPAPCAPSSASQAADDLWDAIEFIGNEVDEDLADKLTDIYETMEFYADQGCYGVVDALADAFSDELYGYFLQFGYAALFNPYVQDLAEYVNARLAALSPAPFFPTIGANTVRILRQIGSGSRGRLIDAGPRITLAVGQILTLQMLAEAGLVNHLFLWQYKWKGRQEGEIPDAAAVAILANYITLVAYSNTSVRLTGLVRHSNGQFFRDVIMVNWVDEVR